MAKRHRKPSLGQIEDELLSKGRWRQYRDQQESEARNHSASDNDSAHRRCRQLLSGGFGAIEPDRHGGFPH